MAKVIIAMTASATTTPGPRSSSAGISGWAARRST